jgi:hypothetical protein
MIEALCEAAHFDISRSEKLHIADAAQCHERIGAAVYSWMKTFLMQEQVFVKGDISVKVGSDERKERGIWSEEKRNHSFLCS